jgi:hypothetical protein
MMRASLLIISVVLNEEIHKEKVTYLVSGVCYRLPHFNVPTTGIPKQNQSCILLGFESSSCPSF